jgi:phosphoenolpyruvate phosphomutase
LFRHPALPASTEAAAPGLRRKKRPFLQIKLHNDMANKKVYLGMVADIMHPGLINIINEGAKYGDVIIGLYTDKAVAERKRLPFLTYEQRKTVIENLKNVSEIVPQDEWSYIPNLKKLKPDYIIHGDDWQNGIDMEVREEVFKLMEAQGGQVIEIPYTKGINSSALFDEVKTIGTTPEVRMKRLRRLIAAKPIVRIMEAHDGLCGLIIENLEVEENGKHNAFDGMWSSSLTDSTSKGKPDIEAVDLTTRLQDLNNILECTTKPIIFDGDTGGKIEHFVFTVRTLERHGISAVIIEDKIGLKKNSLFGTEAVQTQDSIEHFCEKIKAGKDAQVTKDFMIIARIESLIAGKPVADALERAFAYVDAGADGVMIHSKHKSGEDIKAFCIEFRKAHPKIPIVVVPTTYDHIRESELAEWGANVVIYANHMLRAAYPAMKKAAETILRNGRAEEVRPLCMPIKEILELIPGTK